MAHHQSRYHDQMRAVQASQTLSAASTGAAAIDGDEALTEQDEPPERQSTPKNKFNPSKPPQTSEFCKCKLLPRDRKQSLLTQSLTLAHPEKHVDNEPISLTRGLSTASNRSTASVSTADLTSDGHTSPDRTNSPSPPLPPIFRPSLRPILGDVKLDKLADKALPSPDVVLPSSHSKDEASVEAGLKRRRCIRFACADQSAEPEPMRSPPKPAEVLPPKKTCSIRFACPSRVSEDAPKAPARAPKPRAPSPCPLKSKPSSPPPARPTHRDSQATITSTPPRSNLNIVPTANLANLSSAHHNSDSGSDRGGFHEFADFRNDGDEWTNEATCHRWKMTVQDILQKEAKFRRLGEEAEEEALQDEEDLDDEENEDDEDEDEDQDENSSDDGNESDDEGGFADSDCDSEAGSENMFWVPARPASSVSHPAYDNDTISKANRHLATSFSSLDSTHGNKMPEYHQHQHARRSTKPRKIRSEAPELPDSTDFVCGTLDEDRPLEAAYLSCREERRKMKHVAVPQDIDPSFPTSDPEDEDDEDDFSATNDEHFIINGQMDEESTAKPDRTPRRGRGGSLSKKSPAPSPRTLHRNRSPPPKRNDSPVKRLRSPPPTRRLKSPPAQVKLSLAVPPNQAHGINYAPLNKRPGLTHTASLPRSPAPFAFATGHRSVLPSIYGASDEMASTPSHRRGAVDIVKGLENKRQRRREKLAQKCHHKAAKEKIRRPQPGKGAQRMKEVGEQKAGRTKLQPVAQAQAKYVLSV